MLDNPTVAKCQLQIKQLQEAIQKIWLSDGMSLDLQARCQKALVDLEDIQDQRGFKERIITVTGNKNAGKSTFCKLLLTDIDRKEMIKTGYGRDSATIQLTWIGPKQPMRMDPEIETWVHVDRHGMADLSEPYYLLDVPGFNDARPEARLAAKRIIPMASIMVLVVSWESGLEIESLYPYLRLGAGTTLVPVVVDGDYLIRDSVQTEHELSQFKARIQKVMPDSMVADPLYMPHIQSLPLDQRDKMWEKAQEIAKTALETAIKSTPGDPSTMAEYRYARLCGELQDVLIPVLNPIGAAYRELQTHQNAVIREITKESVGTRTQLNIGIRTRLMLRVSQECPGYGIPMRSFLGLLALTAGAWDRLVMAFSGSLPSLAAVIFQSGKNIQSVRSNQDSMRSALYTRIKHQITERLTEHYHRFFRVVAQYRPADHHNQQHELPKIVFDIQEIALLETRITDIIEHQVSNYSLSKRLLAGFAGGSTLLWAALAIGPIAAIYGQFIETAWGVITDSARFTWENFPAPSLGMLFITLILIFAPVLFLSMITLSFVVSKRDVERCSTKIEQEIEDAFADWIKNTQISSHNQEELISSIGLVLDTLESKQAGSTN